jgi:hypothetical protein
MSDVREESGEVTDNNAHSLPLPLPPSSLTDEADEQQEAAPELPGTREETRS